MKYNVTMPRGLDFTLSTVGEHGDSVLPRRGEPPGEQKGRTP